jgi:acyl-coenzyme A thioesterase PaaI-like protein
MSLPPEDEDLRFPGDDGGCFGCSPRNTSGLRLRFQRRGESIVARFTVPDRFHGAPGVCHGGIVATMMDEVSCAAAVFVHDCRVVTGELSIRYRRPCPVEMPIDLSARVTEEHPRYLVIEAELRREEELLAKSTGKFFFASNPA